MKDVSNYLSEMADDGLNFFLQGFDFDNLKVLFLWMQNDKMHTADI